MTEKVNWSSSLYGGAMLNEQYDLIVVGGGIVGAAVVWNASKRFRWRTLWLDRGQFGLGCTAYSGGLIVDWGKTPRIRQLRERSRTLWPQLERDLNGISQRRFEAYVAASPDTIASRRTWLLDGLALPYSETGNGGEFLSLPQGEVLAGPILMKQVNPHEIVRALLRRSRSLGAVACEGVTVETWEEGPSGCEVCCASGERFAGRRLVFAAGPWIPPGLPQSSWPVRIKRVAACHLAIAPPPESPAISFPALDAFLVPALPERRWLLSFRSEEWDVNPDSMSPGLGPRDREQIDVVLRRYIPAFLGMVAGGRAFCDAYTSDGSPLAIRFGDRFPVVVAGGCSGSGVRLALGLAEETVDLLSE
jgi:glycine/D-amino acid oxidase-like deaminating enzyme